MHSHSLAPESEAGPLCHTGKASPCFAFVYECHSKCSLNRFLEREDLSLWQDGSVQTVDRKEVAENQSSEHTCERLEWRFVYESPVMAPPDEAVTASQALA